MPQSFARVNRGLDRGCIALPAQIAFNRDMSQLTPFDPARLDELTAAVRQLLGIPPTVEVLIFDELAKGAPDLRLRIEVGQDGQRHTLRLMTPGPLALWTGRHIALSHAGDPPKKLLDALVQRLQAADAKGIETGPLADLLQANQTRRDWSRVPPSEWHTLGPQELVLRLTFRCNQDCGFCWQDRTWPSPPLSVFRQWIEQAAALGRHQVELSGGEPTLYPDLAELVALVRAQGMSVLLQSNGIRLAKPDVLQPLIAAGLEAVSISYHNHQAQLSDRMTRAPNTHKQTEAGIRACLQAGVAVTLNCVVQADNVDSLPEQATAIVERFSTFQAQAGRLKVFYSHPNVSFDRTLWPDLAVPLDVVRPKLAQALLILQAAGVAAQATGTCGFPLCALSDAPAFIPTQPMAEVAQAHRQSRHHAQACATCVLADACIGPRNTYLERFGERGLQPFLALPLTSLAPPPPATAPRPSQKRRHGARNF